MEANHTLLANTIRRMIEVDDLERKLAATKDRLKNERKCVLENMGPFVEIGGLLVRVQATKPERWECRTLSGAPCHDPHQGELWRQGLFGFKQLASPSIQLASEDGARIFVLHTRDLLWNSDKSLAIELVETDNAE